MWVGLKRKAFQASSVMKSDKRNFKTVATANPYRLISSELASGVPES